MSGKLPGSAALKTIRRFAALEIPNAESEGVPNCAWTLASGNPQPTVVVFAPLGATQPLSDVADPWLAIVRTVLTEPSPVPLSCTGLTSTKDACAAVRAPAISVIVSRFRF